MIDLKEFSSFSFKITHFKSFLKVLVQRHYRYSLSKANKHWILFHKFLKFLKLNHNSKYYSTEIISLFTILLKLFHFFKTFSKSSILVFC